MSAYWQFRGDTFEDGVKKIKSFKKDNLVATMVNNSINGFISNWADEGEGFNKFGKLVPYIGWFWRESDFYRKQINIGDCGEFIGVMENNKWDYPERLLTIEEADEVIKIIWDARRLSQEGGLMSEMQSNTKSKLGELWELFQTFTI